MPRKSQVKETKQESGMPGGGAGRTDEVRGSGVHPISDRRAPSDAPVVPAARFGQGDRGTAGYQDSGGSELSLSEANPELCRDLMTKDPVCCTQSDSIHRVAQLMRDQDIGSVAIVENEQSQKLIGILTDRDLAVRVLADGQDPASARAGDIMTRDLVMCSPDDSISACLDAMESRQVRRMPVVDDSGRIVGMIAQADIAIRLHEPRQTAEVVEEISRPSAVR